MEDITIVWVIRGQPVDPSQDKWPVVVHDLHSKNLRCQYAPRDIALALGEFSGMSKMTARWCPNVGERGEWQLLDFLPDNVTVLPTNEAASWTLF
jgi:hypothetical protein